MKHDLTLTRASGSEQSVFRPGKVDPTIRRAIYFPTPAAPYGSTRELFDAACGVIKRFSGLADADVRLLTYAVFASWVVEFTDVPVSLALVGPPSPERRQLLRILRCLFRRALVLGEASLAGVCSLPMEIGPTLLIQRCEPSSQFQKFLETTSSRDAQILSKGRILNVCCAKVLCIEEPLNDAMPGWLMIELPGANMGGPVSVLDPRAQLQIMEEFQPKLEMFRLTNYRLVFASLFDIPEISSGARDLARCLGGAIAGDSELQAQLGTLLKEQDQQVGTESANELHSVVIEALLSCSHQAKKECVGVAEITATVNKILVRRGELLEMNPRALGNILRALGFSTQRLSATRRGILLLNSVRQRIHRLASKHELREIRLQSMDCAQYDELRKKEKEICEEEKVVRLPNSKSDEELKDPFS